MIKLSTFGTLDLRDTDDGRRFDSLLAQPKRIAVLSFLAASPDGRRRRDSILAMFWPEADAARARNALNQAVYVLRRALGEDAIRTHGDVEIEVERGVVECDAVLFREALANGRPIDALAAYRGAFLDGFHVDDCPQFERWVDDERSAFARDALAASRSLALMEATAGNPAGAAQWLVRSSALAPYDESVIRELVTALNSIGDRAGALRAYESFADRVWSDLELRPSAETQHMIEAIRRGEVSAALGARTSSNGEAPAPVRAAAAASPTAGNRRWRWAAAGLLLLVVSAGSIMATRALGSRTASGLDGKRALVLPFANQTGDSSMNALGGMVADWITHALARTNMLDVVPPAAASGFQRRGPDSGEVALARQAGAGLVVSGSYHRSNGGVAFQARVVSVSTGSVLRAVEVPADSARPIEMLVEQVRQRIAGALATIIDPRMEPWARMASQPPSFEAYQIYVNGRERFARGGPGFAGPIEAADYFLRAAAMDSSFTMPLVWAIRMYNDAGEWAKSDSVVRRLAPMRDRLAPWDRDMFDFLAAALYGQHADAFRAIQRVVDRDLGWVVQAGWAAIWAGQPREAVRILSRFVPQGPGEPGRSPAPVAGPRYWNAVTTARHLMGDFEGELAEVQRMRATNPQAGAAIELMALAALGRLDEVKRKSLEVLTKLPAGAEANLRDVARELRAHGYEEAAQQMADTLVARMLNAPEARRTTPFNHNLAGLLFDAGRWKESRPVYERLRAEEPGDWVAVGHIGILAAMSGDRLTAEREVAWLLDREGQFDYGEPTVWAAAVVAHLGDLERALEIYERGLRKGFYHYHRSTHVRRGLAPLFRYPAFVEMTKPRG